MAQLRVTERPLKASKSLLQTKGYSLEVFHSIPFHTNSIPVLVSAQVLRSRNLGQVDLARISRDHEGQFVEITEVKSSQIGFHSSQFKQKNRLVGAGKFISGVLGLRIKLTSLVG
jgi:uncharacterized phosphosugar-binding protein